MKKIIFIFILFASQSFAQITLTSANNPVDGDENAYTVCDTTNIFHGSSGANQTWSFPNLIPIVSSLESYLDPALTPYAAQFPTSNLAGIVNGSLSYFTTSSTNFLFNGTAVPDFIIRYDDPQLYLQYPLTYNTSFTDNFSTHFSIGGNEHFRFGTITMTGDAWGTINLPIGSFSNALRVKFVTVTKDSANGATFITTLTSYKWFVAGRKFPVFEVNYTSTTFGGIPLGNSKDVIYGNAVLPGIHNISSETPENYMLSQNYPNPFNPTTNLEFGISKLGFVSLKIYDMLGKEIATLVNDNLNPGTYKYNFDGSKLTSGVYFYKLKVGDYTEVKKMTLVK